jgi:hypothetical protein
MKFESTFLKRFSTLGFGRKGGLPRPFVYPLREWVVCLAISALIAVSLGTYAGIGFYGQLTDSDIPEVSEENIPRYRATDAELIIRYYEGKTRRFNELRKDKPYIPPQESLEASNTEEGEPVVAGVQTEE